MLTVHDRSGIQAIPDEPIRSFLTERYSQLVGAIGDGECDDVGGIFIVIEPGDSLVDIEEAAGIPVFHGIFHDPETDGDDLSPCWDWIECHPHCYEALVSTTDGGDFVSIILPRQEGIDNELLSICASFASPKSAGI